MTMVCIQAISEIFQVCNYILCIKIQKSLDASPVLSYNIGATHIYKHQLFVYIVVGLIQIEDEEKKYTDVFKSGGNILDQSALKG